MELNDVIRKVHELLGASDSIELDINDPALADLAVELKKGRVRLELTKGQLGCSMPAPSSGSTIAKIFKINPNAATPPPPPPSDPNKPKPSARPVPKRYQHSYVPPALAKDIVSVLTDEASHIVQLVGPTGCGKTTLVNYIAGELDRKVFKINCRGDMGSESFVGEKTVEVDKATGQNHIVYLKGVVEKAMVEGLDENGNESGNPAILFIDELPACPAHVAHVLNGLFESDNPRRTLVLDTDGGRVVRSHSGLRIIVAGNTAGRGATNMEQTGYTAQLDALDLSLLRRVTATFRMGYDKKVEKNILIEKTGDDRVSDLILKFRDAIRGHIKSGKLTTPFSTGHIIAIADMFRVFGDLSKAIYYAVIEKLLPEERAVYNETAIAAIGKDILQNSVLKDVDYM